MWHLLTGPIEILVKIEYCDRDREYSRTASNSNIGARGKGILWGSGVATLHYVLLVTAIHLSLAVDEEDGEDAYFHSRTLLKKSCHITPLREI